MTSTRLDTLAFYAPCNGPAVAGIVLLDEDGSAALQLRDNLPAIQDPGIWVVPGGHIEPGESPAVGAVREFFEETTYRCVDARPLQFWHSREVGYPTDFHLYFLWSAYDGVQPLECREGQALRFVPRHGIDSLPRRDYLTLIWDLALAARASSNP